MRYTFAVQRILRAGLCALLVSSCSQGGLLVPDSGSETTPDAGTSTGPDGGQGAGPDAGADGGPDAGLDAGQDASFDAGFDAGTSPGADAGADAGPNPGSDAGVDGGFDAGPDAGIRYTPYSCADAGGGSPFDRTDTFTAADGTTVTVTVCGPRPGGPTVTVSPPADGGSAAWLLATAAPDGGTLLLTPGTYDFVGWDGGSNWLLEDPSDLLIDGQGSTLIFHGLMTGLMLHGGQRVLIRNVQIDWGEPLAVSGMLTPGSSACDGGLAFQVDATFPIDAGSPPPLLSMSEFNVAAPAWPTTPFLQAHWAQVPAQKPRYAGGQTYCVGSPQGLASLAAATPAIGISRTNGSNAVYVTGSGNVSFENVTVYASPAESFTFYTGQAGFRMSGCHVIRNAADPARLISSNADGVNFRETLGSCILEDSEFADQGDDGVSMVGQFFDVQPGSTATQLSLEPSNAVTLQAGDTLAVFDAKTFAPLGSAQVTQAVRLLAGDGGVLGSSLTLASPGIAALAGDGGMIAAAPNRSSPNFIVRNVYVHDNDERGMLIQTANGLVDRCTVENDLGVLLLAQNAAFLEGPGASNVTVQNTLLQGCDFMNDATDLACAGGIPAPLSVMELLTPPGLVPSYPNSTILLQNNVIAGAPGLGLLVSSATGVQVVGNTILDTNQQTPTVACGKQTSLPAASMLAIDATNVTFSGNSRDGGTTLGLTIDPTCQGCTGQPGY